MKHGVNIAKMIFGVALVAAALARPHAQGFSGTCTAGAACHIRWDAPHAQGEGLLVNGAHVYKDGTYLGNAIGSGSGTSFVIDYTLTFTTADIATSPHAIVIGLQNANPTETKSDPIMVSISPPAPPTAATNPRVVP
jgi:hypothetical protein